MPHKCKDQTCIDTTFLINFHTCDYSHKTKHVLILQQEEFGLSVQGQMALFVEGFLTQLSKSI